MFFCCKTVKTFHDWLSDENASKIPSDSQGVILHSQLCVRAVDMCKKTSDGVVSSANGALAIAMDID